tara:strand:- start:294 stop:2903 length:2610 start_codon:yes stop_codon:yes gene_type:complete
MAFKSYADGRGFKDFQIQLPNTIDRDLEESNRIVTYLQNDAERARRSRSEELAVMKNNAREFFKNRNDIENLREANQRDILEANKRNYDTELSNAKSRASGGGDKSFLEKLAPLIEYGTKIATMIGEQQQAEAKGRYDEMLNVLVGTGLTNKQKEMLDANEKAIFEQTTEGKKILYDLNEELGLTGENTFTVEHFRLLSNQTGEYELLTNNQLALNSFKKFDRYVQSNAHEVIPEIGMTFAQSFDAEFNGNPELREQAWKRMRGQFLTDQGIGLNELPAAFQAGKLGPRIQKVKDYYFGIAGRGDTAVYKTQQKREERLSFEQGLFSMKEGDKPFALKEVRDRWAQRSFTLDGKPNFPAANDKLHDYIAEGITSGLVGPSDVQDIIDTMGDRFGHGMMGRMVHLKHKAEVHRASATGDRQRISSAAQVRLSEDLELHLNTNAEAAETFQALAPQEQVAELRKLGMEDTTSSKFLSKMYGGKAGNKLGHEINQGGQYGVLKEWVPQILANRNEIAESDLKKVLGHEAAEQDLLAIATQAYNQQWDQTHNAQDAINYAKGVVDETLERGRFDINKDDVKIDGEDQVKSIDGTGLLQYSFGAYHRPGERPQLEITKAKVTATFTGKTKAEGLNMVMAISNPESAAEIMPRSVIEDSMVGGEFNLNIFGRHAAVQRALEETGASVSYLADQLLQGYGLEGLDPRDVATPEELQTLGQFERSTYDDRTMKPSHISQEVNARQIEMNNLSSLGVVSHYHPGNDIDGNHGGANAHGDWKFKDTPTAHYVFDYVTQQQVDGKNIVLTEMGGRTPVGDMHAQGGGHYDRLKFDVPWDQFGSGPLTNEDKRKYNEVIRHIYDALNFKRQGVDLETALRS